LESREGKTRPGQSHRVKEEEEEKDKIKVWRCLVFPGVSPSPTLFTLDDKIR